MGSVDGDVERLQTLLAVEDHAQRLTCGLALGNEHDTGMEIRHELSVRDFEKACLPKQQGAERVATHDGVHQQPNLIPAPDKITLKIRQD